MTRRKCLMEEWNKEGDQLCIICMDKVAEVFDLNCEHCNRFCRECVLKWYIKTLSASDFRETLNKDLEIFKCPYLCSRTTPIQNLKVNLMEWSKLYQDVIDEDQKWCIHYYVRQHLWYFDSDVVAGCLLFTFFLILVIVFSVYTVRKK